jgi:ATP-binding cassette subfamily B protein
MKSEETQIEAAGPAAASSGNNLARGPSAPPGSHKEDVARKRLPEPDSTVPLRSAGDHLRWIWEYWRPLKTRILILFALTLISTAVAVMYPLAFRWVIDKLSAVFAESSGVVKLSQILWVLVLIAIGRFIAGLYPAARAWTNLKIDKDIREDTFAQLMKKDYHFNNTFRTGDVVTRLTDDIYEFPKISWFSCSGIFRAFESSFKLIFCITVMLTMNWKLTLLSIIPLPIMTGVFYSFRTRIRRYVDETQRSISDTNDLLEAAFSGIRIVKAFRGEEGQKRRLAGLMKKRRKSFLELMKVQTTLWSLDTLASRLGQMIVIAAGGFMIVRGETTIGTLFAFYVFLDMLAWPMMDLPHLLMSGQQAFVSIRRVEEIKSYPVKIQHEGGEPIDDIREIAVDHLSFSYDGGRRQIDDVSFEVPAGKRVAVVGPVASGKSTLLKLLAGILVSDEGVVRVNGRDLRDLDWDSYKKLLGYVPQEGVLFSKSIRENVMFGREPGNGGGGVLGGEAALGGEDALPGKHAGASSEALAKREEWIDRCLRTAQMEADLKALPEGLTTLVGTRGLLVSGGQMQRIAIARALAGRPKMLLLDDCTAALDAHNEEKFWAGLREFGESTCFIVSHRLSTIRQADHILVLDDGRLVDQGTHEELESRCGVYRTFLMTEIAREHLGVVGAG